MPRGEVAQVLYNMKGLLPEIPAFEWSIEQIDESLKAQMQESGSWKPGAPISFDELRLIHVSFWGFDAKPHTGRLVVNHAWAEELCAVFRALYEARFPIRSMNLIDEYGASDKRSMAADNSSAYNGRFRGGAERVEHACVRAGDRHQSDRESVGLRERGESRRGSSLRGSVVDCSRRHTRRRRGRSRVRLHRLEMGRLLGGEQGLSAFQQQRTVVRRSQTRGL